MINPTTLKPIQTLNLIILFISLITLTGCSSATPNTPRGDILNVSYGPFEENALDMYFPETNVTQLPAVIYIHGGGFTSGDKDFINNDYKEEKDSFLENNIIVISINYRLLDKATLTEILEEDIVSAVQFIKFFTLFSF